MLIIVIRKKHRLSEGYHIVRAVFIWYLSFGHSEDSTQVLGNKGIGSRLQEGRIEESRVGFMYKTIISH